MILAFGGDAIRSEEIVAIGHKDGDSEFRIKLKDKDIFIYVFSDEGTAKRACAAAIASWKQTEVK